MRFEIKLNKLILKLFKCIFIVDIFFIQYIIIYTIYFTVYQIFKIMVVLQKEIRE